MFMPKKVKSLLAAGAAAFSLFAFNPNALAFQEYPIGDEIEDTENHFKVALVYFQPVPMEPLKPTSTRPRATSAASASANGFLTCASSTDSPNAAETRKVRLPAPSCP